MWKMENPTYYWTHLYYFCERSCCCHVFFVCLGRRLTCAEACKVVDQNVHEPSWCWLTFNALVCFNPTFIRISWSQWTYIHDIVNKIHARTTREISNPKPWSSKTPNDPNDKFSGVAPRCCVKLRQIRMLLFQYDYSQHWKLMFLA